MVTQIVVLTSNYTMCRVSFGCEQFPILVALGLSFSPEAGATFFSCFVSRGTGLQCVLTRTYAECWQSRSWIKRRKETAIRDRPRSLLLLA